MEKEEGQNHTSGVIEDEKRYEQYIPPKFRNPVGLANIKAAIAKDTNLKAGLRETDNINVIRLVNAEIKRRRRAAKLGAISEDKLNT